MMAATFRVRRVVLAVLPALEAGWGRSMYVVGYFPFIWTFRQMGRAPMPGGSIIGCLFGLIAPEKTPNDLPEWPLYPSGVSEGYQAVRVHGSAAGGVSSIAPVPRRS